MSIASYIRYLLITLGLDMRCEEFIQGTVIQGVIMSSVIHLRLRSSVTSPCYELQHQAYSHCGHTGKTKNNRDTARLVHPYR